MATLVDALDILKHAGFYETIFPFILVFAVIFGVLTKLNIFGENKYINGTVSALIALFFISMVRASKFLSNVIPMLTAMLLVMVFLVLIFMFMGVKGETIARVLTEESQAYGAIIIVFILLVIIAFTQVFPEQAFLTQFPGMAEDMNVTLYPEDATSSEKAAAILSAQAGAIIFSPKILAMIVMFVTFAIATYYIVREKKGG